jgi:hypothetical protein
MNFSKKNHEHKGVNLKSVSKKIILSVVFVFASFAMVNANEQYGDDCVEYAWAKTDQLQEDTGANWSDWDYWDVTNYYYEQCMGG